jgi:DNA processing protein
VLAVPGSVLSGRNRGGHALLRDGAKIVESADDILEELRPGASGADSAFAAGAARAPVPEVMESDQSERVLACLNRGEPCDLDALVERCGAAPSDVLAQLFDLELRGVVRRVEGGQFVRIDRSC